MSDFLKLLNMQSDLFSAWIKANHPEFIETYKGKFKPAMYNDLVKIYREYLNSEAAQNEAGAEEIRESEGDK